MSATKPTSSDIPECHSISVTDCQQAGQWNYKKLTITS